MRRIALAVAFSFPALALAQEACEAQRVVSPPAVATYDFSWSIKTNDHQWFVSSSVASTLCAGPVTSCSTGAVFAYELVEGQLEHTQTIYPLDGELNDNFGDAMDVEGNRLAIGSLYTRRTGSSGRAGAVFVYEHDGEMWVEVDRIEPPLDVTREFGNTVKLIGDTLIVTPLSSQRFFVYERADGSWSLKQVVQAPEPISPAGGGFGLAWAQHGNWVVTSAYVDRRIVAYGGAVFVYQRQPDGTLELFQQIRADQPMYLGSTLAFDGDTLLIGAPLASRGFDYQGVVQFYEFDGDQWGLVGELESSRPGYNHQFGLSVALHDDLLLVNAFNERTASSHGVVYRHARESSGAWVATGTLDPDPPGHTGRYGAVLAMNDRHALAGAWQEESASGGRTGAAYFFDLTCTDCKPDLDVDGSLTVFDFLTFLNLFQDADSRADFDGDGELTIFDFLTFLNLFQDADSRADFDGDGELTIFDFLAFQTAFDAGCE